MIRYWLIQRKTRHAEVDEVVEVQGVCLVDTFVIALQEVVVVRAEEEHKGHDGLRLLDRDGEGPLEVAGADVAAAFALGLEGELIILEARSRSDQYGAEVLVLEGYPAQRLLDIFVGFAGLSRRSTSP